MLHQIGTKLLLLVLLFMVKIFYNKVVVLIWFANLFQ